MWTRPATVLMLLQYKQHENLYNIRHPGYTDRAKRSKSLFEIYKRVKEVYPDVSVEGIKSRMHGLRSKYLKELNEIKACKRSGAGRGNVYVPKLWCYSQLEFLGPYINARPASSYRSDSTNDSSKRKVKNQEANPDVLDDFEESGNDLSIKSRKKKVKHQEANPDVLDAFEESGNDLSVLGQGWSSQYAELSREQKLFARKIISDVFFHGCLDKISDDIVREIRNVLESNLRKTYDE